MTAITLSVVQPVAARGVSWLESPYRLLIRTSLALGVAAGFSLGLYLLLGFAFGWPLSAGTPALIEVHGQIQVFGFLVMFIMAVGVQLFPRFHASRLDRPAQVSSPSPPSPSDCGDPPRRLRWRFPSDGEEPE